MFLFGKIKEWLGSQSSDPSCAKKEGVLPEQVCEELGIQKDSDAINIEDAWNFGNSILASETLQNYDMTESTECMSTFVLEITKQTIPALLKVGSAAPMIAPVAGVLLDFYRAYQDVGANREAFLSLEARVQLSMMWLQESKDLFEDAFIDPATKDGIAIVSEFKQLCTAIRPAASFVRTTQQRFHSENMSMDGVKNGVKNFVKSQSDKENLSTLITSIEYAVNSFKTGLSAYQSLSTLRKEKFRVICEYAMDSAVIDNAALLIPGTRSWLFEEVEKWLQPTNKDRLFWLQATAGMGKTVFTTALAQRLKQSGQLLGVYMFQFQDQSHSTPIHLIRMIARQIATEHKELREKIVDAAKLLRDDNSQNNPMTVFKKLLLEPLEAFERKQPMVIVIDALDEIGVEGSDLRKKTIEFVSSHFLKLPAWVKLFVSGRPEADLVNKLGKYAAVVREEDTRHGEDLKQYLENSLRDVNIDDDDGALVRLLLQKSEGRFIYTAVVAGEIIKWMKENADDVNVAPISLNLDKLRNIIDALPDGINGCYEKTFQKLYENKEMTAVVDKTKVKQFCQLMVAAMEPLSVHLVSELLGFSIVQKKMDLKYFNMLKDGVATIFPVRCGSDKIDRFYSLHKSVIDWLRNENTSREFRCDVDESNLFLLEAISKKQCQKCAINNEISLTDQLVQSRWYEWFGLSSCPTPPSTFQWNASMLSVYVVKYICDHFDVADDTESSFTLLMSLPFMQAALEVQGIVWLRDQYGKRATSDTWYPMKRPLMKLMMRLCELLLGVGDPKEKGYVSGCLSKEICTQIVARLNPAIDPCVVELIRNAKEYIEINGGILLNPQSLLSPDGLCETVITVSHAVAALVDWIGSNGDVHVAATCNEEITIYERDSWEVKTTLKGHSLAVNSLCVLPNGRLVSGSEDCTIRLWDIESGECVKVIEGHSEGVSSLCALPDGRVVSGSWDYTIRLWDTHSGECVKVMKGHTDAVFSLCILSDGRVVSGSYDGTVRVWDVNSDSGECMMVMEGHSAGVTFLCALPDSRVASASYDKTIRLWDVNNGECVKVMEGHMDTVSCLCVLSGGRVVSGSDDKTIRVWDVNTGECVQIIEGHALSLSTLHILLDGRVASSSEDKTIRIWGVDNGGSVQVLDGHSLAISSLCMLPDGRVASGSWDCTIRVWDANSGECVKVMKGHTDAVLSLYISPDGRVVSESENKTIRVWDVDSGVGEVVDNNFMFERIVGSYSIRSGCFSDSNWVLACDTKSSNRFAVSTKDFRVLFYNLHSI